MGIPPSQVRPERRQFLHHVAALVLLETRTYMKHVPLEDILLFVHGVIHRGLISGVLVVHGRVGSEVAAAGDRAGCAPESDCAFHRGRSPLANRRAQSWGSS